MDREELIIQFMNLRHSKPRMHTIIKFKEEDMDKLEQLFKWQKEFMKKIGMEKLPINSSTGQDQIRITTFYLTEELFEAMNLLKMKPWRKNAPETDENKYKGELIDAFHFFLELLIISGITAEDLHFIYAMKMMENINRQKKGY